MIIGTPQYVLYTVPLLGKVFSSIYQYLDRNLHLEFDTGLNKAASSIGAFAVFTQIFRGLLHREIL